MSTIFTILFASPDEDEYGSLSLTFLSLFTSFVGSYGYISEPNYVISGSLLVMFHRFASNVFLFNFLISILSAVYELMLDLGEFEFKKCKY